jgi:hypothetical protein
VLRSLRRTRPQLEDIPGTFDVRADPGTSALNVTAEARTALVSVRIANAAAQAFPAFRGRVLAAALRQPEGVAGEDEQTREGLSRLRLLERLIQNNATVVDRATTAEKTQPAPLRNALIGLVAGLIVGLLTVSLREALTTRPHGDAEVEQILGVPVIASPVMSSRRRTAFRRSSRLSPAPAFDRLAVLLRDHGRPDTGTVVGVVSAGPDDGKTTLTAGLALALAARGHAVAAVALEPDQRSALPELLGAPPASGQRAAGAGGNANGALGLITTRLAAGDGPSASFDPADGFADVASHVAALRADHDWVLVATPAALESAEAAEVARVADVLLIAVEASSISRKHLVALSRELGTWPKQPVAAVLAAE